MIGRSVRIGTIGGGMLVMVLLAAVPVGALNFSDLTLVYREDFEGEVGFPTSPEVNLLSIGATSPIGVDGAQQGFAGPYISGGVAVASIHSMGPTSGQNVHVPSTFSESFGIRATLDGFSIGTPPADGSASAGVVAGWGGIVSPTAVLSVGIGFNRFSGFDEGYVVTTYTEPFPASPVIVFTQIGPSGVSAILGGSPFTVDLAYDEVTQIGTASVDISGIGVVTAPPLDISGFTVLTSSTSLAATSLFLSENLGAHADVNMEDISVFLSTTLIGDDVTISRFSTSDLTTHLDTVVALEGSPEITCPSLAYALCGAEIPGLTEGNFDIEDNTLTLNVGLAGSPTVFAADTFNGYRFSSFSTGVPVTEIDLVTDIPGLTSADLVTMGGLSA